MMEGRRMMEQLGCAPARHTHTPEELQAAEEGGDPAWSLFFCLQKGGGRERPAEALASDGADLISCISIT